MLFFVFASTSVDTFKSTSLIVTYPFELEHSFSLSLESELIAENPFIKSALFSASYTLFLSDAIAFKISAPLASFPSLIA